MKTLQPDPIIAEVRAVRTNTRPDLITTSKQFSETFALDKRLLAASMSAILLAANIEPSVPVAPQTLKFFRNVVKR